jgi:2-dehydro-3-deoxygluconokinase
LIDAEGGFLNIAPHEALRPVDTTAAGDSFNAGYLAARIGGASPIDAARAGHRLAGIVIMTPGAIIAREAMPQNVVKTGAYS